MRTLVTGAAGFIGSHVVQALLQGDHEVGAVVRGRRRLQRLDGLGERLSVINADLDDQVGLRREVTRWKPEACIHLAWYAEPGKYLESTENIRCLSAGLHLLEALAEAGCRRVVMAGTCAEYDTDAGYLREDGPVAPTTLYAASKLALNLVASSRALQLGVSLGWARLFYQYGPHEDARRLVPSLILTLLDGKTFRASTGRQVRDYLHVADVAAALRAMIEVGAQGTFNVSSGEPITVARLMGLVAEVVGRPDLIHVGSAPERDWDPPFIVGDNRRLRAATSWTPMQQLEDGLRATVNWWRTQRTLEPAA